MELSSEDSLMGDIETCHDDLDVGVEDDGSRFGVVEDVELGERPSVSANTSSSAHEHDLLDTSNEMRVASNEEPHVGHWTRDSEMNWRLACI